MTDPIDRLLEVLESMTYSNTVLEMGLCPDGCGDYVVQVIGERDGEQYVVAQG